MEIEEMCAERCPACQECFAHVHVLMLTVDALLQIRHRRRDDQREDQARMLQASPNVSLVAHDESVRPDVSRRVR